MRTISLKGHRPLASGKKRLVFACPDDPSLVIKVLRSNVGEAPAWLGLLGRLFRRYYRTNMLLRELREYLMIHETGRPHPCFIVALHGFAQTEHGLGLVMQALYGVDGEPASTLDCIIAEGGMNEGVLVALESFCADIAECPVIIGDLNLSNVVLAHDGARGDHFVLVDGLGDKTWIPVLRLLPFLSRRAKRRKTGRLMAAARNASAGAGPSS